MGGYHHSWKNEWTLVWNSLWFKNTCERWREYTGGHTALSTGE